MLDGVLGLELLQLEQLRRRVRIPHQGRQAARVQLQDKRSQHAGRRQELGERRQQNHAKEPRAHQTVQEAHSVESEQTHESVQDV